MGLRNRAPANDHIPARNLTFTHEARALPFFGGNLVANMMFVVFSGIFPDGERFFVRSVRRYRDDVHDDPELEARVRGFAAQESLHGREHARLNAFWKEHGVDPTAAARRVRWSLRQLERFPHRYQLAFTAFMEHFTTHLAEQWLTHAAFTKESDPRAMELWQWHALEELEHKSVAFDVLERVGGTSFERRAALPVVLAVLAPGIVYSWLSLVANHPDRGALRAHAHGLIAIFGKDGFLTPIFPKLSVFHRAGFHPDKHDTRALEAEWRERLFGREGILREAVGASSGAP